MDGVDAALVRLSGPPDKPRVRLLAFTTIPYPSWIRQRLLQVAGEDLTTASEISGLNVLVGEAFAKAALRVCRCGNVSPKRLAVIGSHGQTIHHYGLPAPVVTRGFFAEFRKLLPKLQAITAAKRRNHQVGAEAQGIAVDLEYIPKLRDALKGKPITFIRSTARSDTLQIAEPAIIADRTGALVVADFRPADIAAGGQGAPLVPMVDYLLLRDSAQGTVALNIGGIANITGIPAAAKPEQVFGFDTGPGNMVMDALVRHFTRGQKGYDADGRVAARGKVIEPLLAEALTFPFFRKQPPKSAGREQFGEGFVKHYFLKQRRARFEDLLRTTTELTARSIVKALERFVFPGVKVHRLIVSGGGAHNRFLMSRLRELLPQLSVERSDKYGLPVDAKEAIAFALLADRTLHGLPGNLPSVTGARRAVVLGKLVMPSPTLRRR
jgi:anhydro-N-acetylmuramic acid kinase